MGMIKAEEYKIVSVIGARPNFMKILPICKAIEANNRFVLREKGNDVTNPITHILVHTGQHYDFEMSEVFFRSLGIPEPDINLEIGSASHAVQTANIMIRFEQICLNQSPDWIIVVGDVNSTLACALVASKLGIRLAHVEAGLRSYDRSMPEEINRVVTDSLADLLLTPSQDADENLIREGIPRGKIRRVGNIMIDTLVANLEKARQSSPLGRFGVKDGNYIFVTLHRPASVDNKSSLSSIMKLLSEFASKMPIIFPMHPRTKNNLEQFGIDRVINSSNLIICNPLGYHDTIGLVDKARFVLTDSGGLQEETTFLNIPCLTLRPNTERPVTITQGTNQLTSLGTLKEDMERLISGQGKKGTIPELWDGHTAERVLVALREMSLPEGRLKD
jgi:UDP-N-acetylglucosamine 2-epimerase (non-hydrolysing)